ncbi:MAG: hypothetical protein ACO1NX_00760 [Chitinophagaceae bacterium]
MKKFYVFTSLLLLIFISGCSKDFLKSYDRRIVGTWVIDDIDRYGFSGRDNLPFKEGGIFNFNRDGEATYTIDSANYKGSWDIRTQIFGDETVRALQLTVVDFNNQRMLSDYFNDMRFISTNRFNAFIEYNTRTYVYRFKRI